MTLADDLTPEMVHDQLQGRDAANQRRDPDPNGSTMYYRAYVEATLLRHWRAQEQQRAVL